MCICYDDCRLKEAETCDNKETSPVCKVGSHGKDPQQESCKIQSSDLCQDLVEPCTSVRPVHMSCSESKSLATDGYVVCSDVTSSACVSSCESDVSVEAGGCEKSTGTKASSVQSVVVKNDYLDKCQPLVSDTEEDVFASGLEHWPAGSDLHLHQSAHSHEHLVISSVPEPHLPPSSDSVLSLDSTNCDILSNETESRPVVGFSESDAVHSVDDMQGRHDGTSTRAESMTRNVKIVSDCAVTAETVSATDSVCTSGSDCTTSTITDSIVSKLNGRHGVRHILTASVSDVPQPVEETVAHIGSTRIHVTDELSVVNGVVRLVESAVKIGEFLLIWLLYSFCILIY